MLLFWRGQATHGHNVLRRFMLQHHTPRPGGGALVGPLCNAVWGENLDTNQIAKARWWVDNDLPLDYFWIDAGWYGDGKYMDGSTVFNSEWGMHAGNWWPNRGPYPNGLKPVGDALREMGPGLRALVRARAGARQHSLHPRASRVAAGAARRRLPLQSRHPRGTPGDD